MKANWNKAKEIFAAAAELNPDERIRYLETACEGDAELLKEVTSLLSADDEAGSFMDGSAVDIVADSIAAGKIEKGRRFGQYEVAGLIGSGGMGEIYLARDTRLNRKVALKILPTGLDDSKKKLKRFEQEAFVVSALNHPNILTIHDFGTIDEETFIVSEYVEGVTLREKIADGSLTVRESVRIAVQIASALSAAHRSGVVHRDIKPENVMIRPDGVVKVLDFGIAKLMDEASAQFGGADDSGRTKTHPGIILGTVNYMSPEQARGQDLDPRSDIFSFGAVFYEMLTARPPFDDENAVDTISLILHKVPDPINARNPDVPAVLALIVEKMLAKSRDSRYQNADRILEDLTSVETDLSHHPNRRLVTARVDPGTDNLEVASTGGTNPAAGMATHASSAEYLLTELKMRRRSIAALLGLLLIGSIGLIYWLNANHSGKANDIGSVAVMPFVNASGNPEQEYLSDGITETLITGLSQLPRLKVKARSSVFRYKGREIDPKTIGSELGVEAILNGRLTGRGDELILNVELVDTDTENVLWSESYQRKASELVALQSEIARDVSRKLQRVISAEDGQKVEKNYTASYEAFQHYLKGRFFWNKRTGEGLNKAVAEFGQAVNLDPNFALAYVGLADSYALIEQYLGTPSSETMPKAKSYASRALEIDDSLAEAHTSLAFIYYAMWEWDASDREFRRAIELKPNYSTAHHWYYVFLRDTGRLNEAIEQINIAKDLDPLSLVISVSFARAQFLLGNDVAGIELTTKLIELYPEYGPNHMTLGAAYVRQGRKNDGLAEMTKAYELDPSPSALANLAYASAVAGKLHDANRMLKDLTAKYERREMLARDVAIVYIGLEDHEKAFEWLEKDFASRSSELAAITSMQEFDPIRSDPRYVSLLRRMGLKT
jgi:TolB-like protein/Flp pilus assembly protein TadD